MDRTNWIVDSGACTHVCCNTEMFNTTYRLDRAVIVNLPDGASKRVIVAAHVQLNAEIILRDVLYLPGFTHNLLSVGQLIQDSGIKCTFYQTRCMFQKMSNEKVIEIGKMERNLYVVDAVVENHFTHFFRAEEMTLET